MEQNAPLGPQDYVDSQYFLKIPQLCHVQQSLPQWPEIPEVARLKIYNYFFLL